MCLCNYFKGKLIEPITVYKVLFVWGGKYMSPYIPFDWEVGKTYINEEGIVVKDEELYGGVFHCYEYLEDAICGCGSMNSSYPMTRRYIVGRFTIPKGSDIYIGTDSNGTASIASRALTFDGVEDVDDETFVLLSRVNKFYLEENSSKLSWWVTDEQIERVADGAIAKIEGSWRSEEVKECMIKEIRSLIKRYIEFRNRDKQ